MGRPPTGRLEGIERADGTISWVARFSAYGKRRKQTIGRNPPMSEAAARAELDFILEQVKRGQWVPADRAPAAAPAGAADRLTIGQLAAKYLEWRKDQGRGAKASQLDELLRKHVVPDWGERYPEDATPNNVERWVKAKVSHSESLAQLRAGGVRYLPNPAGGPPIRVERAYGPRRLNRALNALLAVLDYGSTFHNAPDMTRKLRMADLKLTEPSVVKSHFTVAQVALIIEAAGQLDEEAWPGHKHVGRQALCAILLLGGFRIDEACSMLVGDVLRTERLMRVVDAKTASGKRSVNITYGLEPYLLGHIDAFRAGARGGEPVFATRNGKPQDPNNVREDVWYKALARAQELARARGMTDNWPERGNPHVTRRTFITQLFELGEQAPYVQSQVGHASSKLTMDVYADVVARRGPVPALTGQLYGTDRTRRVEVDPA